jgi:hypothetical protein
MGVLKVWDGTDWRKVGCGGAAAAPSFGDDFDRADSLTSVGGTGWVAQKGTWGILDNRLVCRGISAGAGPAFPGGQALLRKDSGSTTIDLTVEHRRRFHSGTSGLLFGYDPSTNQGYWLQVSTLVNGGVAAIRRHDNGTDTTLADTSATVPYWDGALADSALLRVTYDPGTGVINVYRDGTLIGTATDASPFTTGTWNGVTANVYEGDGFSTNDAWDAPPSAMGRLRLWTGTGWVREACDDDTTTLTDTFDRANSSSNPNPASDGGTWTVDTGTAGISSNQLYFPTAGSSIGTNQNVQVSRDLGSPVQDVTVTNSRSGTSGSSFIIVNWDPALGSTPGGMSGYIVMFDSTSGYGSVSRMGSGPSASCAWTSTWTGSSAVLRVTSDGAGTITVYQGGTQVAQITSAEPSFSDFTGTWVALATNTNGAGLDRWNDFNATGGPIAHPLKIEDPSSPGDWITVGCFVPV